MCLAAWSGRPLDVKNVGAYLEPSTLVCRIAQPGKLEAILVIDQEQLDFVAAGQRVDLLPSSHPGRRLSGRIDHIAEQNMDTAPERLSARGGGQLASRADASGVERLLSVTYQASVPLDDPELTVVAGTTGMGRIHAGYRPLYQRLYRAACRTFHFEL